MTTTARGAGFTGAYAFISGTVSNGAIPTDFIVRTGDGSTLMGTEKMRVLSGGNVGIGTTTPAQKLDVNGTAQLRVWWV